MELDIGKHCELDTCKQLDYCPFLCHHCKKNFCLEHRMADSHDCWSTKTKPLPIPRHVPVIIKCDVCKSVITNHIITPYKCPKCDMNVCSTHRYLDAHECVSLGNNRKKGPNKFLSGLNKRTKDKQNGKSNNSTNNATSNIAPDVVSNVALNDNANSNKEKSVSCIPCNILKVEKTYDKFSDK